MLQVTVASNEARANSAALGLDGHSIAQRPTRPTATVEVVALDQILSHEQPSDLHADLVTPAILAEVGQRRPLGLARDFDGALLQLYGAELIAGLKNLHCRHAVAQVFSYADPNILLDSWTHLTVIDRQHLIAAAALWDQHTLTSVSSRAALALLNDGRAAVALRFASGESFVVQTTPSLTDRIAAIRAVTSLYNQYLLCDPNSLAMLSAQHNRFDQARWANVAITFARFSKLEVSLLARQTQLRLPTGITRHQIIDDHAPAINAPLTFLQAALPTQEKTSRMHDVMAFPAITSFDIAIAQGAY